MLRMSGYQEMDPKSSAYTMGSFRLGQHGQERLWVRWDLSFLNPEDLSVWMVQESGFILVY